MGGWCPTTLVAGDSCVRHSLVGPVRLLTACSVRIQAVKTDSAVSTRQASTPVVSSTSSSHEHQSKHCVRIKVHDVTIRIVLFMTLSTLRLRLPSAWLSVRSQLTRASIPARCHLTIRQSRYAHHDTHLENTRNIGIIAHVDAVSLFRPFRSLGRADHLRGKPRQRSACSTTVA